MPHLGQHFLKNRSAIKTIAAALELKDGETVIEIGPGHGELTGELQKVNSEGQIVAIEKDEKLASELRNRFQDPNVEILTGDILKILPRLSVTYQLQPTTYKLVGNIPYYLTGRLLRILSELKHKPVLAVFTIQREVAERLAAKPPRMNLLAASVQFWSEPKILKILPPEAFDPPPEVSSAIIQLIPKAEPTVDPKRYYVLMRKIFKQPRKTILNNLTVGDKTGRKSVRNVLSREGLSGEERPQNLSLELLTRLATVGVIQ